jgi:transcriptional regulator with XRE-family HTH domain
VDDVVKRLGQRIRDLRSKRGWSQEEFAHICGVHRTYMGHLERGEKNLSFSTVSRLATALEVSISDLFAGLDSDEVSERSGGRQARPRVQELDRSRLLRAVASLERTLELLREVADSSPRSRRTPQKKRPRRSSK